MLNQIGLVSQTSKISASDLSIVSAAIQKQLSRDVAPLWDVQGSVDSFDSLESVPLGYWHVIIMENIPYSAAGIHLNLVNGQPYALVEYSDNWSLTTSHEIIEMVIDPSGSRTIAGNSPRADQGRVLFLVEACDPSESARFAYSSNGVLVSDFYTQRFFDPVAVDGVRYSFTGAIKEPRQVLEGGYLSWLDPGTQHLFQLFVRNGEKEFFDRGPLPAGFGTLRSFSDLHANNRPKQPAKKPRGLLLTGALGGKATKLDASRKALARSLQEQVDKLVKSAR